MGQKVDFLNLSQDILSTGRKIRLPKSGSSMFPLFKKEDFILIEPIAKKDLSRGDILVFKPGKAKKMVAHRLMKVYCDNGKVAFLTKGDFLGYFDAPIYPEQVLGKVVAVERKGKVIRTDRGRWGFLNRICFWVSPFSRRIYPLLKKIKHAFNIT